MSNKLDITSSAIEKGIEFARDFLDKLIGPALEETGLLIRDQVTLWKFKNQIRILNKAKAYCEKHDISTKQISLKVLCPLLDHAALEEDELLQDKWAALLSNMVYSAQNIENHVFPYILSQVSTNEFLVLDYALKCKTKRVHQLQLELEEASSTRPEKEKEIEEKISKLEGQINALGSENKEFYIKWEKQKEIRHLKIKRDNLKHHESRLKSKILAPEKINHEELKEYEISNLLRLGIVKEIVVNYGYIDSHSVRKDPKSDYVDLSDVPIEIEADESEYILTELGELFVEACSVKPETKPNIR